MLCKHKVEGSNPFSSIYADIAQLGEQIPYKDKVGSSSLSVGTFYRDVAQLVARVLWEHEVVGSNPVIPILSGSSKRFRTQPFQG